MIVKLIGLPTSLLCHAGSAMHEPVARASLRLVSIGNSTGFEPSTPTFLNIFKGILPVAQEQTLWTLSYFNSQKIF